MINILKKLFAKKEDTEFNNSNNSFYRSNNTISKQPLPVGLTDGQRAALDSILAGNNVFLSGAAGAGKSFLLSYVLEKMTDKTIACAPTGRAALIINGSTIHNVFKLDVGPIVDPDSIEIPWTISACKVVLIDEISMVRRDVFDAISSVLFRENSRRRRAENKEFAEPIQLVCVGDFCQLPPVVDKSEGDVLAKHYDVEKSALADNLFAFQSVYWDKWNFDNHYLTEIIRQNDSEFINALNQARVGNPECVQWFNEHASSYSINDAVMIEGKNADVDYHNELELNKLQGKEFIYFGKKHGEVFYPLPAPLELKLKIGARVMITYNTDKNVNGELGTIVDLDKSSVIFQSDNGERSNVPLNTWVYYKYGVSANGKKHELLKEPIGEFTQFPLKLAWSVSIHKSQGQTYDASIVDPATWDVGMLYVALSRVRTVEKLKLKQPINRYWLMTSKAVGKFYSRILGAPVYQGKVFSGFKKQKAAKDFIPRNIEMTDHNNPIFNKTVVFTGDFVDGTQRDELRQLVADLGGKPQTNVSGKTNYVVQSDDDYSEKRKTSKIKKAEENIKNGKDTVIISETQWRALINKWV